MKEFNTKENLFYYLTNGYLFTKTKNIYPYKSLLKQSKEIPELIYDNLDIYNRITYGLNINEDIRYLLRYNDGFKRILKL